MGFRKDFIWGAATASYQIEGAYKEDGKGWSVWDEFAHTPNHILFDQTGDVACDHYHRYQEDVSLMKEIGLNGYRFSTAWTRILPEGRGKVNQKGLDFYDRLVDELLKNGIDPFVTLYHWDMPYALEQKGGFRNREIVQCFAEYADVLTRRLGDRVKNFMTLNEPQCQLNLGYKYGIHAPGNKLTEEECAECMPNMLLCHGVATDIIRKNVKDATVGFAACGENFFPVRNDEKLVQKAYEYNFGQTTPAALGWFTDPICLGRFPEVFLKKFPRAFEKVTQEDMKCISQPVDYVGFNIYTAELLDLDEKGELKVVPTPDGTAMTAMSWPIYEDCMYWMLKFIWQRYQKPIVISENGMANTDRVFLDGKVHDPLRIDYMQRHIGAMERAVNEGVDMRAYFAWSFMDNYEWAFGYERRFGLVHVDYQTQKRTVKDSGYWYRDFIKNAKK